MRRTRSREMVWNIKNKLSDVNYSPRNTFSSVEYRLELDTSMECNEDQVSLYQNLIEILRLFIELGHMKLHFQSQLYPTSLLLP